MNKEELIAKLKEAKSADELLALAKENGVEIAPEKAKELFQQMNANGELTDDQLESVAGGGLSEQEQQELKDAVMQLLGKLLDEKLFSGNP